MSLRIFRWEKPGKYDQLPFGTEIVRLESVCNPTAEIFKQMSRDPHHPLWESIGMIDGSTAPLGSCVGDSAQEQ